MKRKPIKKLIKKPIKKLKENKMAKEKAMEKEPQVEAVKVEKTTENIINKSGNVKFTEA